jgi:hypothetical protein
MSSGVGGPPRPPAHRPGVLAIGVAVAFGKEALLAPLSPAPFSPSTVPLSWDVAFQERIGPWDILVDPDGSIVATEYFSCRLARFSGRYMGDTTQCRTLSFPDGEPQDCEPSYDLANGTMSRDPRCVNSCIEEQLVPGSWVSDMTHPPLTQVPVGTLLVVVPDRHHNLWFDQGYQDRKGRFHLWPALLALYPTTFSEGGTSALGSGIGGSVAVVRRNGEIWAADYEGRRLNRLRRMS